MTKQKVVRKFISKLNKKTWTTRYYARNKYGHETSVFSDKAVRWCAIGLLSKIMGIHVGLNSKIFSDIRYDFTNKYGDSIVDTNDDRGFEILKDRFINLYKD
jgi:hypothetical protein